MAPNAKTIKWSDFDPNWNEVVRISNRWANSPPPSDLVNICDALSQKFSNLLIANLEHGKIKNNPAELKEYATALAQGVAFCMKASVQLGLEYGHRDPHSQRSLEYVEQQIRIAMPLLTAASVPIRAWLAPQLCFLIESNQVTEEIAGQYKEDLYNAIMVSQFLCFQRGIAPQLTSEH